MSSRWSHSRPRHFFANSLAQSTTNAQLLAGQVHTLQVELALAQARLEAQHDVTAVLRSYLQAPLRAPVPPAGTPAGTSAADRGAEDPRA